VSYRRLPVTLKLIEIRGFVTGTQERRSEIKSLMAKSRGESWRRLYCSVCIIDVPILARDRRTFALNSIRGTATPIPPPVRDLGPDSTVKTGLETRWGGGPDNPTIEEMRAALAELDTPDEEHPSTWLSDDNGWTVDVYESGLVIFPHQYQDICQRRGVSRDEALELWLLLQRGKHDEIKHRLSA